MNVLLLNQFFHPDLSATSQLATELAEDLAAAGMGVTAVASRGSYLGGARLPSRDRHRGVEIVRVGATSLGKGTVLRRALDYASFHAAAALALARLPRHDVVLALTTPPLLSTTALVARALRGSRLVCWVQDLYPEVAVAMGALREGSAAARAMAALTRAALARADRVVALGEGMAARCVAAGARAERTVVIPNWADPASVRPVAHEANPLREGIAGGARVVAMYSGNLGRVHDVATPLAAARLLAGRDDVRFVFVGDGARRGDVEVAARALRNVRLLPYAPRERLAESLGAGDLHLVTLVPEAEGLVEPSKLYGIMAAGRPALLVGPEGSEAARTVRAEGCGVVLRNGDAEGLAAAIADLVARPEARLAMGARARSALEARHARTVATARFAALLREVAGDASGPRA